MKIVKKAICLVCSALACLCVGFAGNGMLKSSKVEQAQADATAQAVSYNTNSFAILPTASVRKTTPHGIRFRTVIGNSTLSSWGDNYTLGTLIIPEDIYLAANRELTTDFSYNDSFTTYVPSVAEFSGNPDDYRTDAEYPNCKLFNAVLDLTRFTQNNTDFFDRKLVARTFVTINGTTHYADNVSIRSAAYVAAASLDIKDEDTDGIYTKYVSSLKKVELSKETLNVTVGGLADLTAAVTPADVYPVTYTVNDGVSFEDGKVKGKTSGMTSITVSVAGGKVTDTVNVSVVGHEGLERMYYQSSGTDADYMTFNAYDVDDVKYNGKSLKAEEDYTKNGTEVVVNKSVLYSSAKRVNDLTLCSKTSGDVTANISMYYATTGMPKNMDYSSSDGFYDYFSYYSVRDNIVVEKGDVTGELTGDNAHYNGYYTVYEAEDTAGNAIDFYEDSYIEDYYDMGMEMLIGGSSASCNGAYSNYTNNGNSLEKAYPDLYRTLEAAHRMGRDNSVIVTDGILIDMDRLNLSNNFASTTLQEVTENVEGKVPTFIDSTPGAHQYATQAALDAYVEKCMLRYCMHPAFGGIMLRDEPNAYYLPLVAEIYASIQRVYKKLGLEDKETIVMLLPLFPSLIDSYAYTERQTVSGYVATNQERDAALFKRYGMYLDSWLTRSGDDELRMDIYPLYDVIYRYYGVNIQIAAEVAQKNNAKLSVVTSSWKRDGDRGERDVTYADMNFINNILMAYGSKNIGYYTYHTQNDTFTATYVQDTNEDGSLKYDSKGNPVYKKEELFPGYTDYVVDSAEDKQIMVDGWSPINRQGEKTVIYDYVKELNAKGQVLTPVLLNFDYKQTKFFTTDTNTYTATTVFGNEDNQKDNNTHLSHLRDYAANANNTKIDNVDASTKVVFENLLTATPKDSKYNFLVNELYDAKKKNYMYAVMNVVDPLAESNVSKTIELKFAEDMTHAWVFHEGAWTTVTLNEAKTMSLSMTAGKAYYIIPYNVMGHTEPPILEGTDYMAKPGDNWGDYWGYQN